MIIKSIRVCTEKPKNFHVYSHFTDLEVIFFQSLPIEDPKQFKDLNVPFNLKRLIVTFGFSKLNKQLLSFLDCEEDRRKHELLLQELKEQCIKYLKLPFGCKVKIYIQDCKEAFQYFQKHTQDHEIESIMSCSPACKELLKFYK